MFTKEVFQCSEYSQWGYNIYSSDGTKCVHQDVDPELPGNVFMSEERANTAADEVLAALTASET